MHKAGFVNIVGNPNVGKSTLMNLLVGERISIATFKAQTTRHRIMGILNTDDMQIVFSDTPGVLKPNYKLQESMLNFSESALVDADVLLYVTDTIEQPDKNQEFMEKVRRLDVPVLLLINKIDLSNQEDLVKLVDQWHEMLPKAEIIPVSAKARFNVDAVMKRMANDAILQSVLLSSSNRDVRQAEAQRAQRAAWGAAGGIDPGATTEIRLNMGNAE